MNEDDKGAKNFVECERASANMSKNNYRSKNKDRSIFIEV